MSFNDLDTWEQYGDRIRELKTAYGPDRPEVSAEGYRTHQLFRGHADQCWKLETTLERCSKRTWTIESYMRKVAHLIPRIESIGARRWNIRSWEAIKRELQVQHEKGFPRLPHYEYWAYLRHHGIPSPLIDWSESPLVAAWFAFAEEKEGVDRIAVWMYADRPTGSHQRIAEEPAISLLGRNVPAHERDVRQESMYTFASKAENEGHSFVSHEDVKQPRDESQDVLVKVTMPGSERAKALKSLDDMNINGESVYGPRDALDEARAEIAALFSNL